MLFKSGQTQQNVFGILTLSSRTGQMQLHTENTVEPAPEVIESHPWDRPIWKPTKGKGAIFFYLVLIHVVAVIGLILFPIPSLPVAVSSLILVALGGLGTTVCYHRTLSHRTLRLN